MARSTYVYLVVQPLLGGYLPVAAFTVKRELTRWIRQQPSALLEELDFYRMHDNPVPGDKLTKLTLLELLDG